jgi:hypothetical protein
MVRIAMLLGLPGTVLAAAMTSASVPLPDPHFRPYRIDYIGPAKFCHSTYWIELGAGEKVALDQKFPWVSQAAIELREGRFSVHETSAGYTSGRFFRRAGNGRLLRVQDYPGVLRFDNGMPGSTASGG